MYSIDCYQAVSTRPANNYEEMRKRQEENHRNRTSAPQSYLTAKSPSSFSSSTTPAGSSRAVIEREWLFIEQSVNLGTNYVVPRVQGKQKTDLISPKY